MNLTGSSCSGNRDQDIQEVPTCQGGNNHYSNKEKESPSRDDEEKEEDEVATVVLGSCMPATESPPPTIKTKIQEMFLGLGFSLMVPKS